MFKSILIGHLTFLLLIKIYGQDSLCYKSKFQWKAMICYNFPLSKFAKKGITDNFISYHDNSISWQILSFNFFFSKHLGIDASFQLAGSTKNSYDVNGDLANDLAPKYSQFYVTVPFTLWSNNSDPPLVAFNKANIGIIYRLESGKINFYPKLSVGITSFSTFSAEAYLKEKNTNNVFHLLYKPNKPSAQENFTISASTDFGYKIAKNLLLFLDLNASVFKPNFSYSQTTTNLFTGTTTTENYNYEKPISSIGIGMGIIFEIDRIKRIKLLGNK